MADAFVAELRGLRFQEGKRYVCLTQCASVCTLLNNVHVCACVWICVRTRADVSGGAKWASAESRKDLCSWHISATVHDGGERASMYPCSANYDPSLSPSLSRSISLLRLPPGQWWFNDERDHFDYSYTADKSAGRAVVSHRRTQTSDMHRRTHILTLRNAQIQQRWPCTHAQCIYTQ